LLRAAPEKRLPMNRLQVLPIGLMHYYI
jgi:hypothetical protein